jgi:hypothetical protein
MGENDPSDSARLERRLWAFRVAILPWLALVLGPLFLDRECLPTEPIALYLLLLFAAVPLHLGAMLVCRRRPGLAVVGLCGALLFAASVITFPQAIADSSCAGSLLVSWAGLLALFQLTIVVAAGRAWLLAPPGGPTRYLAAFAGASAPFLIWAVIAPSQGWLGHPAPGREALAIRDIRTMISAQSAYQAANGGFYDVPECLVTPRRCIPTYPVNAPTFLDSQLGRTTADREGYRRVFHSGAPADPAEVRKAGASPSSLLSFAYVATPLIPGQTGVRAFCGDSSGVICFTSDGQAPGIENGRCTPCQPLQ